MVKSHMPTGKTVSGRKKSKVKKASAKSKTRSLRKMPKREAGKKADHNPAEAGRRRPQKSQSHLGQETRSPNPAPPQRIAKLRDSCRSCSGLSRSSECGG